MERATHKDERGRYYLTGDGIYGDRGVPEKYYGDDVDAFGLIEDILGDTYDLDRLREAVEKKDEYERFMKQWEQIAEIAGAVKKVGAERVAELVEADKAGRCVVLPVKIGDRVYTVFPLSLKREAKVEKIEIDEHGTFLRGKYPSIFDGDAFIPANVFGTYAFTKEAEAKKAERQQIETFLAKETDQ